MHPVGGVGKLRAAKRAGSLHAIHDDGSKADGMPGDVYGISPRDDASTVGDEGAVLVEFQGAANYAKRK